MVISWSTDCSDIAIPSLLRSLLSSQNPGLSLNFGFYLAHISVVSKLIFHFCICPSHSIPIFAQMS